MIAKIEQVNCFCKLKCKVDVGKVNVATAKITKPTNEILIYDSVRKLLDVLNRLLKTRIDPSNLLEALGQTGTCRFFS